MVAAIVLVAVGLQRTLADVGDPLEWETATALLGGSALYLVGLAGFKLRALGSLSLLRLGGAAVLVALIPLAHRVDAVASVAMVALVLWALLVLEAVRYAEARHEIRHAGHTHG